MKNRGKTKNDFIIAFFWKKLECQKEKTLAEYFHPKTRKKFLYFVVFALE